MVHVIVRQLAISKYLIKHFLKLVKFSIIYIYIFKFLVRELDEINFKES